MKTKGFILLVLLLVLSSNIQAQLDTRVSINEKEIKLMKAELEALENMTAADNRLLLEMRKNGLDSKNSLLELKQISIDNTKKVEDATERVDKIVLNTGLNREHLNRFWMLLAAMLVFFMQAGFKVFEVGLVRVEDRNSVGIKNLMDWMIVAFCFWVVGFGLMFGNSQGGWIGTSLFGLTGMENIKNEYGYEYFLFQLAFAATAVTIVSGALAVRIKLVSYIILSIFIALFIYPVFGHWVWGGAFTGSEAPFLAKLGFVDFAGSTVVHSVGAWIALTGMWFIRPRFGKVNVNGRIEIRVNEEEKNKFKPHNLGYSVLGVLILWFGWWGFNGGSTSFVEVGDDNYTNTIVPLILINTNLAAVAAGLAAFFHCFWFTKGQEDLYEKTLGGVLSGLVAITACCDILSVPQSILVGLVAGVLHNLSYDRLYKKPVFGKIIDDPVGAIPVHGVAGIFGTLCVALGADAPLQQLGSQVIGVVVCAVFTVTASIIIFSLLRNTIGLEVSRQQEKEGKNY